MRIWGSFVYYNQSPAFTSTAYIHGTTGGSDVNISINSATFSYLYNPAGSGYAYLRTARNTSTPDYPTVYTSTSSQAAAACSGHGGGYGANGGFGVASESYSSSSYSTLAYGSGSGGAAIRKWLGTEVITFTGDIAPSAANNAVCRFLGSYT